MEEVMVIRIVHSTDDLQENLLNVLRNAQVVYGYGYDKVIAHFEDCTFYGNDTAKLTDDEKANMAEARAEGKSYIDLGNYRIKFNYNL